MNSKIQGVALILFGILLNLSAETIHDVFFSDISYVDIVLTVISVIIGIIGLIMNFIDIGKIPKRKEK